MPIFLTQDQIYRILQREQPPEAYPDGAPSAFFSTADQYSVAKVASDAYSNLNLIYDNYFPQFAVQRVADWEITVFGTLGNALRQTSDRLQDVVNHFRIQEVPSVAGIKAALTRLFALADLIQEGNTVVTPDWLLEFNYLDVDTYLGYRDPNIPYVSLTFELVTWGCSYGGGAWRLDESYLDVDTYLVGMDPIYGVGLDCDLDYAALGLTLEELEAIQETAYTYEVRIIGNAEQVFLDVLEALLNRLEPARSRHYIYNNFPGPVDP